ncbi:hypothetical protein R1sor_008161 [Riccia sorocarpa]|uniref:Uncharacterized protein n=1 Tax=Riccia sorocarpa TaxID=122646 RepID=A0ABD3HW68_9MARC
MSLTAHKVLGTRPEAGTITFLTSHTLTRVRKIKSLAIQAQLEYEVESEAEDEGHEELHDSGVADSENVAENLQQLPPLFPNQQSGLDLQATFGQDSVPVPPPAAMELIGGDEQGLGEVPAVNPPAVASMETGELPAVNPPAVEIMGQTTVAEDDKPQSQTGDVRVLASGSGDKRDGKGSRKPKRPRTKK